MGQPWLADPESHAPERAFAQVNRQWFCFLRSSRHFILRLVGDDASAGVVRRGQMPPGGSCLRGPELAGMPVEDRLSGRLNHRRASRAADWPDEEWERHAAMKSTPHERNAVLASIEAQVGDDPVVHLERVAVERVGSVVPRHLGRPLPGQPVVGRE